MNKKLKKSIISIILIMIMIVPMLSTVYAENYSVTAETENLVFKGEATAESGKDYEFSFEMEEDIVVDEIYSEIKGSVSLNKNSGEGEKASTTILGTTTDDTAFPEITMVEDNDSPMCDVLKYKRVITDSINAGTSTTYKNQAITSLYSSKPSTVSFGFWLKESDIETVFGDNTMQFWPIYQGGSYMVVGIPLASLMKNIGVKETLTPQNINIGKIFKSYDVSAVCTARDGGWAHFVCNMENLVYNDSFTASSTYFYLTLNNVTSALRQNKKIEMSNFTYLINDKIESGYIVYPNSVSDTYKCAVKKGGEGKYIIPKEAVNGDVKINAKGVKVTVVKEYPVAFGGTYTTVTGEAKAYSNADYEFSVECDDNTELYSLYASIEKSLGVNKNSGEGTATSTTFLSTTEDTTAFPKIEMVTDKDSPMSGVLPYKRVITDSLNAGTTTTYKNQAITSILASKPTTISFGFWLKESDINTVFGSKVLEFWTVYMNGTCMKVGLPLSSLMENVGVAQEIAPTVTTIDYIFKTYSVNAVCTARDSGWAHFVCNMENLTYPENFSPSTSYFYLYLANVSGVLRQGNKIEMSNFTYLTNEKIKSGYIVYPSSVSSSFKASVKDGENGKYAVDKGVIMGNMTINANAAVAYEEGYEPRMKCIVTENEFSVRTHFDDSNDLIQRFKGVNKEDTDYNDPIDFIGAGLVSKNNETMTGIEKSLSAGGDEATPFKYNASYIGANHGQSNGILVTATAHGKTYADIGSLWKDSAGAKWNLLKVMDENTLMFLSENVSTNINKYSFKNSLSGTLTYVESGEHTQDITVESIKAYQQVYSSTKKLEKAIYTVINGIKYKAAEGLVVGCDYVEVVEKYQIINPATIGAALRANRPAGGYTEPQNLAVGDPIVEYNMIYRIMPDGTVLSIFDHEILENINFLFYGGIQYVAKKNAFGGGVYRYIPKLKTFTHKDLELNFTESVNMTELTFPSGFSKDMTKDLWDGSLAPDRQIDYYKDSNKNISASFAGGYLPILDGEPIKRSNNINAAGFVYQTKKTYPYFLDTKAFSQGGTKNQRIQGVAYKKYNGSADSDISYYTIPYGQDTYIYVDCHEISQREFDLSYLIKDGVTIKEIEKSANVTYVEKNGKVNVKMAEGTYGYLVLCVSSNDCDVLSASYDKESGEVTAKVENNTHSSKSVYIVSASYNGNRLSSVKAEPVTLKDSQIYNYKASFNETEKGDKAKIFVWDDISSMSPEALGIYGQ